MHAIIHHTKVCDFFMKSNILFLSCWCLGIIFKKTWVTSHSLGPPKTLAADLASPAATVPLSRPTLGLSLNNADSIRFFFTVCGRTQGFMADILNDDPDEAKASWCHLPQRKEKSRRLATSLSKHQVSAVVAQQKPVAIAEDFCDRFSP